MTMTTGSTAGGAVYDRGYRPYEGPVGNRWAARWALFRLTARRALGIRRSWRQKVLPWTLLALATVPAIVNVGVKVALGDEPIDGEIIEFISYRDYVEVSVVLLLFVAVAAPDAVCPDRHDRVFPLIFSRPLTGADYVVAKVAAIAALIFGFGFFPQVVLFVGQTFVHEDGALDYIGENGEVMWQVPASVALVAVLFASVAVALSSLTDRRIVGGVAILGSVLVTGAIAAVLVQTDTGEDDESGARFRPERPVEQDDESGRFVEPGSDVEEGFGLDDDQVAELEDELDLSDRERAAIEDRLETEGRELSPRDEQRLEELFGDREGGADYEPVAEGSAFGLIDFTETPLYLRDVIFLGHVDPLSSLGGVERGALLALLVYLGVLALSLSVLLLRYREVGL